MKKRFHGLLQILLLAAAVAFLNEVGHVFYLYWSVWWYDLLLHFLGGLLVGLVAIWVYLHLDPKRPKTRKRMLVLVLISIAVVGVGWEIYELMIGVSVTHEPYPIDTAIDLIMDVVGAFTAYRISRFKKVSNFAYGE